MSRYTRYALFDNGEGTVLNLTFDGHIVAKFYDDEGRKLLGTLCQYIGRTDKMFLDAAADYFRHLESEYGTFRGRSPEDATEAGLVAGEAYQVIGSLSHYANLFDHPEVQRALDWFSGFEPGVTYKDDASILPWPREELKAEVEIAAELATENAELAARVKELEVALQEVVLQIIYLQDKFQETGSGNAMLARLRSALAKKEG